MENESDGEREKEQQDEHMEVQENEPEGESNEEQQDEQMEEKENDVPIDMHDQQSGELYLLFKYEASQPEKAITIGKIAPGRQFVHGKKVGPKEGAFELLTVMCNDEIGPDDEPLQPNTFIIWPLNRASKRMGMHEERIRFRGKMFTNYLKSRGHAQRDWEKVMQKEQLNVGDHVLVRISRADRSNTCPRVMEAKVVEVDGIFVKWGRKRA